MPKLLTINPSAIDDLLKRQNLKQWWVAEQLGIDRKTLTRWLTGQTKQVQATSLTKLASLLGVGIDQLHAGDSAIYGTIYATTEQQKAAALLIEQESLVEALTPSGKWPLLEGLLKANLVPGLPKTLLAQLYNYLCIAAWRQSNLSASEAYLVTAFNLLEGQTHMAVFVRAKLNQATLASFRGNTQAAIDGYQYCIEQSAFLDSADVKAAALSNLGCVYQEYGDLSKAICTQQKAINAYEALNKPLNLGIAWIGLCDALIEQGKLKDAQLACEKSRTFVLQSGQQRGVADCDLFQAMIHLANNNTEQAQLSYQLAISKYEQLQIFEGRNYLVGAQLAAQQGNSERALAHVERLSLIHI